MSGAGRGRAGGSNLSEQIAHYRRLAARFDRSVWSLGARDNRNHLAKARAIARAIGAETSGRVLEVGCGTGLHAAWLLASTAVAYTGVDASADMLAIARERVGAHPGRARLGIADAHRLPFAPAAFDATFCSGTLHHLGDPARGLAEMARVTRAGGRVAAMEPHAWFPSVLASALFVRAERHALRMRARSLEGWARSAGLEEVRLERLLYTPPVPRSWAAAWDRADAAIARVPGLRRLSIMLLVSGTVPR